MKPHFKQRSSLLRALATMTISILILLALSCIFIVTSSNKLKLNAAVMKATATQRSISQQITNYIAADNLEGKLSGVSLENLLDSFTQIHNVLLYGDKKLNILPLKENMILEYHKLDVGYIRFFQELDRNISNDSTAGFISLLNAENFYLQQLDNFTTALTGFSNEEVKSFQLKEICILLISIVLIILEIKFIFLPAIQKIEGQNSVLREISFTQAHILRRPLTNIQSLLTLILDTKKQDSFTAELLLLAKKEADELDSLIKNNIYKSDKNNKIAI